MARVFTQNINGFECIGDSLSKINLNFDNLDTEVQTLSTDIISLSSDIDSIQTQFNTQNIGPSATLTTNVSSLSVYDFTGNYIGFIPIYN